MRTKRHGIVRVVLALAAFPAGAWTAEPADDVEEEIRELRAQVEALSGRLRDLERRRQKEDAKAPAGVPVTVGERGFAATSVDRTHSIRIGALVQLDSRTFFGDAAGLTNNSFVLRRARLFAEGRVGGIYSFQVVPEFAGSQVSLLDANLTFAPAKTWQVKFGRFKAPLGLEMLQSDPVTFFVERSVVSNLVPNRDVGIQLGGSAAGGALTYAVGVFNGVPDNASAAGADFDNDKDVIGRLFLQPFRGNEASPLRGLGIGVAGSLGRHKGAAGLPSGYKTDGQQTFFKYSSSAVADGQSWRLSPQAYYAGGPFSALGEYVVSAVNARPTATGATAELRHRAWQIAAGWVVTGEGAGYSGVTPRRPFSWTDRRWGAWQIVARHARLRLDRRTFPDFASSTGSAQGTTTMGLGVNWYLSASARTSLDWFWTRFDLPAASSSSLVLQQDENVVISRFQLSF